MLALAQKFLLFVRSASIISRTKPIWTVVSIHSVISASRIGQHMLLCGNLDRFLALSARCSENLSIIHGFSGNFYLQHFVNQPIGKGCLTRAHVCRWLCYEKEPGMLNDKFSSQSFWKSRRYLRKNQFLQVWLRREIQTLLQEEDVDVIVYHILGVIESFFKSQQKTYYPQLPPEDVRKNFKKLISDAARTFLSSRTDRFVDELELFLASGLTLDAYDMVYMEHLYLKPSLSTSNLRPAEEEDSKLVESND
ncbi:RING/U-box superfamily protein isoform X2 [Wolffia australiana]